MNSIRPRLAILVFTLSVANVFGDETNKMVLHWYTPPHIYCDDRVMDGMPTADAQRSNFVARCGVSFPPGSYLTFDSAQSSMCMFNTEAMHEKFRRAVEEMSVQNEIELDASFVSFDLPDIESLAHKNLSAAPTESQIAEFWKSGKGHLLGTHKLITRSGVNAQSQGVDEVIYPTQFSAADSTNAPAEKNPPEQVPPVPGHMETREAGMIFNITPCVGPDGHSIDIVVAPELSDTDTDDITTTISRGENNEENLIVRQPRFHTAKLTTTVVMEDGATLIQGGMASRDGQSLIYLFLTARIIGADGRPAHPDAESKVQAGGAAKK